MTENLEPMREPMLTAGTTTSGPEVDRSPGGIQYQSYQMGLTATGSTLGVGRRTVNDPNNQFRNPPTKLNQQQFAGV